MVKRIDSYLMARGIRLFLTMNVILLGLFEAL
jgi:hypothetical protein